jgi:hypothetical protein
VAKLVLIVRKIFYDRSDRRRENKEGISEERLARDKGK